MQTSNCKAWSTIKSINWLTKPLSRGFLFLAYGGNDCARLLMGLQGIKSSFWANFCALWGMGSMIVLACLVARFNKSDIDNIIWLCGDNVRLCILIIKPPALRDYVDNRVCFSASKKGKLPQKGRPPLKKFRHRYFFDQVSRKAQEI